MNSALSNEAVSGAPPLCGLMGALTTTAAAAPASAQLDTITSPQLVKVTNQSAIYRLVENGVEQGIKVLVDRNPSEEQILRLVHEKNISNFLPAHIRRRHVLDVRSHKGSPAILFQWAKGTPLNEWINDAKSRSDVNDAIRLRVAIAVAESLAEFHQSSVAHRKLSSSNIILDTLEGSYVAILVDLTDAIIYSTSESNAWKKGVDKDLKNLGHVLQELFGCEQDDEEQPQDVDEAKDRDNNTGPNKRVKKQLYRNREELPMYLASILSTLRLAGDSSLAHTELYSTVKDVLQDLRFISKNPSAHLKPFVMDEATMNNRLTFCHNVFYGRQSEKSMLSHALNSVLQLGGQPSMTMVQGAPGCGKTSLVEQIKEPLLEANGYLIRGKFELNSPQDSVIFAAINAFFAELHADADPELKAEISHSINNSLGAGARVLIRSMPSLGTFMKEYYTSHNESDMGFASSQQRWKYLLCKLIAATSRKEMPIAIFLDDLQWADDDSFDVLRLLATDPDIKYCLFLGAHRDNDSSSSNRIRKISDSIQERGVSLMSVKIGPILQDNVNTLVAELLCLPPRLSHSLSAVVYSKTGGIALFVLKFLKSLNTDGLLWFSLTSRRWEFDIAKIRLKEISKDVVTHLTERMKRLPHDIQSGLKFAACIGANFSAETLQLAISTANVDIQDFIESVVEAGFLHERSPHNLTWVHDQVQQAAYELIPQDKRESFHLLLGTRMYLNTPSGSLDKVLFPIVCNMNAGTALIRSREQKFEVAKLNMKAGSRLIASSVFSTAAKYLVAGCKLLDDRDWDDNYDFAIRLHDAAGDALFAVGDFATLREIAMKPLMRARSFEDKLNTYHNIVRVLSSSGKLREVVAKCSSILDQLGEPIPEEINEETIKQEAERVQKALAPLSEKELLSLPVLKDQRKIAIMMFLNHAVISAYVVKPPLIPYLVSRMVNYSIENGVCNISVFAFAMYGSYMVNNDSANFERGCRIAKVAIELMRRLRADEFIPRVYSTVYGFTTPWKEPYQAALVKHIEGYQSGALSGDIEFATANLFMYANSALFACGENLQKLEATVKQYIKKSLQLSQYLHGKTMVVIHDIICVLTGSNEDSYETFLSTTEEEMFADCRENHQKSLCRYVLHKCKYVAFISGDMNAAAQMFEMALQYPLTSGKMANIHVSLFIDGLIAFYFARKERADKECWKKIGDSVLLMFRKWSGRCTWNFINKLYLLQAERFFLMGDDASATVKYNASIKAARQHRFIHEEGIAHERLAWFHMTRGRNGEALQSFTEAKNCYTKWGAVGIVGRMEVIIRQLLSS